MGLIDQIGNRKVYLDTNIFIYAIEGHARYAEELRLLLKRIEVGELVAVTSELTLAEVLPGPLRMGNDKQASVFRHFLRSRPPTFNVLPVTRMILEEAANLRATTSLKLPDAIHAATALLRKCEAFVTNDSKIKPMASLEVLQLDDVIERRSG